MRRRALLLTAVLVGVGGCADGARDGGTRPGGPGEPAGPDPKVLDAWRDFPVDRKPRPLVLVEPVPHVEGFTTDEAKIASMGGRYELAAPLPPDPPVRLPATLPDGPAALATIPAARALDLMRAAGSRTDADRTGPPVKIVKVELGSASFRTDRGPVTLPAWLFHPVDAIGPITMPALAPEEFWPTDLDRPDRQAGLSGAPARAEGRTLTVNLPKAPGPCPGDRPVRYEAVAVESDTAVVVGLRNATPDIRLGDCPRTLMLEFDDYQVQLTRPLGTRVLLDTDGAVFAVTTGVTAGG